MKKKRTRRLYWGGGDFDGWAWKRAEYVGFGVGGVRFACQPNRPTVAPVDGGKGKWVRVKLVEV